MLFYFFLHFIYSPSLFSAPFDHTNDHETFACSIGTVDKIERFYQLDATFLGYTFDAARDACRLYGQTAPPRHALTSTAD